MDIESRLTPEEETELARLLTKLGPAPWPEAIFQALHGKMSAWAPEIVAYHPGNLKREVLLARYDGGVPKFKDKWQLPGGYNRWEESDIATTMSRVWHREVGADRINVQSVLDVYKWKEGEHDYGRPLSVFMLATTVQPIEQTDRLQYFPLDSLPEDIVTPHGQFLKTLSMRYSGSR